MCNDFLLWWLVETRLILQESLLELLLVRGTLVPIEVDVLRTWSPPKSFNCPSAVFGIVTNLGEIISFALSFTLWNSDASILSTCSRSATIRVPFQTSPPAYQTYSESVSGNAVLPNWWNFNRSKKKQIWSDNHSNEPNTILRLHCFVEAPFP